MVDHDFNVSLPIIPMLKVMCNGSEANLSQCNLAEVPYNYDSWCNHQRDIVIQCTGILSQSINNISRNIGV